MLALLSLIVIPSLFSTANGVTITTESNNKIVLNGTKLELEWTVNPSSGDGIISRNVYLVPDFNNPIILGTTVEPKGQELFGENRLSATFADPKYTMTLKDVKYNETGTFRFSVFFQNNGLNATVSDIRVVVTGSPIFCDINLEYHHTVNESEVLTVVRNVCGYPIPELKWKVGDDNFSTASSPSVINNATRQYKYSFNTRPITRKDCGKNISLVTSNSIGSMERNAEIDVKFVPSLVREVLFYRHNASCVRVTWKREDTGKCVINYHLQFTGRETIYNTSNTYFTLCNATDVEKVTIWASYNGNVGNKTTSGITTTTLPPTTTPTTTTTNGGDKSNIGLIVGIVGGILFVIIIIIVVCVLKHKKKNGTGNHSGYAMRMTGEENNYVTDPTRSNGRQPGNPDDPEQAIYSELGPGGGRTGPRPAPEQSDYAEMKVDAMGYPIDGANASEPPTYAPVIKPREGAKRRTPSPPRSNVDGARAAASSEPPTYAPIIKNRSSSRGRSPPPDEDVHEGVIV